MTASIPLAVSPSQLTPGLYLSVNLLAGPASPGVGDLKVALIAPRSSAGDLAVDSEVRRLSGDDGAQTAFGIGTVGHLAAKEIFRKFRAAQVDAVAPTAGAGTASLGILFTGTPSQNNVVDVDLHGEQFELAWLAGETGNDMRAKLNDAISARSDRLFVAGVSGGTGLSTIQAKIAGNIGNDVLAHVKLRNPVTSTEAVTGASGYRALSGGTTDPDLTTALSLLAGQEYHFIAPALSNTDVANVSSTNNLKRIKTHVDTYNSGLDAKLQQVIAAYTGTLSAATATTSDADSIANATYGELLLCMVGRGLPATLMGREVGGRLAAESKDPSANRIGELLDGYVGAADVVAEKPTITESETALGAGVSLVSYTPQGLPVLVRAITTHSQYDTGGADRRLLDVQNVSATYIIARDLRTFLPAEFPQAKVCKDVPDGEEPPPPGVIEERDIKGAVIGRLRFWQLRGVIQKARLDAAIADGSLIVQVNPSDPTQVDMVIPISIVQPLAKMGVVVNRVPG